MNNYYKNDKIKLKIIRDQTDIHMNNININKNDNIHRININRLRKA